MNGASPGTSVTLDAGENVIPVVVTSKDDMATKTYQVTVVRVGIGDYRALIAQMYECSEDPVAGLHFVHTPLGTCAARLRRDSALQPCGLGHRVVGSNATDTDDGC